MSTTRQRLGEIRKDFQKGPFVETFKMMDADLELKVTINYQVYIVLDKPTFGCYAVFELFRKSNNAAAKNPILKCTGHAPTTDDISPSCPPEIALGFFGLTGSSMSGFHVNFDKVEIESIHFSEGDRLLDFFKKMYGVKIVYDADIFGFLNKSGKKEKQFFPLPYPVYELSS